MAMIVGGTPIQAEEPTLLAAAGGTAMLSTGCTGEALAPKGGDLTNAPQDIFSDAKIVIPEFVFASSSYDMDSLLSSGLIISVVAHGQSEEKQATGENVAEKKTQYRAQIDCYQEEADDRGPLGELHYVLEGIDDLCATYHGYKVSV